MKYLMIMMMVVFIPLQVSAFSFTESLNRYGIDIGIEQAMVNGIGADEILNTTISTLKYNPHKVLTVMCEAGINISDIRESSMNYGVSPLIFSSAMIECKGEEIDDIRAYSISPVDTTTKPRYIGIKVPSEPYASPSKF